jgi:hypothetical protein
MNVNSTSMIGSKCCLPPKVVCSLTYCLYAPTQFRWLIRCCRRFVRTLHKQASLHRNGYRCRRLHAHHGRRQCWSTWRTQYGKRVTTLNLSARIHGVKLGRRVLREWHHVSIVRLTPAATMTAALVRRNVTKATYMTWRRFFEQRGYQARINTVLRTSHKRRVLGVWRAYLGQLRQSKRIFATMQRRVLRPLWQRWRNKVSVLP